MFELTQTPSPSMRPSPNLEPPVAIYNMLPFAEKAIEEIPSEPTPPGLLIMALSNSWTLVQFEPPFSVLKRPPETEPAYITLSSFGSMAIPLVLPPTLSGPSSIKLKLVDLDCIL